MVHYDGSIVKSFIVKHNLFGQLHILKPSLYYGVKSNKITFHRGKLCYLLQTHGLLDCVETREIYIYSHTCIIQINGWCLVKFQITGLIE